MLEILKNVVMTVVMRSNLIFQFLQDLDHTQSDNTTECQTNHKVSYLSNFYLSNSKSRTKMPKVEAFYHFSEITYSFFQKIRYTSRKNGDIYVTLTKYENLLPQPKLG